MVRDIDADATGAQSVVDERVNKGNLSVEFFTRIGGAADRYGQSFFEHRQFVLVELGPNPNDGEVGDIHNVVPVHYFASLVHPNILDHAFEGREERKQFLGFAGFLQESYLFFGNIPEAQALFSGFDQPLGAF